MKAEKYAEGKAYEAITNTGLEAKYKEVDKGDHIEVVVRIPKK